MQDRVKGPAIGLIILGAIGIIFSLIGLLTKGLMQDSLRSVMPPEDFARIEGFLHADTMVGIAMRVVMLLISAFVLYGGVQMLHLRNRTIVMIAAVAGMIPCIGPCCLIGLPVGIWALVVLSKPDVKQAFTS